MMCVKPSQFNVLPILLILLALCELPVDGQRRDKDKGFKLPVGSTVLLKIPGNVIGFEKIGRWSGRLNYSAAIQPGDHGGLIVGGRADWKTAGDLVPVEFILAKVARKDGYTEVELRASVVNVKLRFTTAIQDLAVAFNEVAFVGSLREFQANLQTPAGSSSRSIPNEIERADGRVSQVIARAETYFKEGELHLKAGNREQARDKFDKAVDAILESGLDVRANQRLQTFYLELVERIYRLEVPSQQLAPQSTAPDIMQVAVNTQTPSAGQTQKGQAEQPQVGFRQQDWEPSPLDELSKLTLTPQPIMQPSQPTCANSARDLNMRGLRLGMNLEEVRARVPRLSVRQPDQFGYTEVVIRPTRSGPGPESLKGVTGAVLDFLDGRLFYILMVYDNSVPWNSADQFISRISSALNLTGEWETYPEIHPYRGEALKTLNCGKYQFIAGFIVSDDYKKLPVIYWYDDSARNALRDRKDSEAEKLRRKKLQEEEEKRRAFKP